MPRRVARRKPRHVTNPATAKPLGSFATEAKHRALPIMPSLRRIALVFTCVLAALATRTPAAEAPAADAPPPARASTGPRLRVAAATIDFGQVRQGAVVHQDFEVSNTGDQPLAITNVQPSCGCTTAGAWPHQLAPGAAGVLSLQLDTGHFTGPVVKTVAVLSNDPTHPETILTLRGTVWTPVTIVNPVLIFPAADTAEVVATRATTLRAEVDHPVHFGPVTSTSPQFKPVVREVVPGKEVELTVTTVPPLEEGTQSTTITIGTSLPEMPEVRVEAVATVLPALQVAPMAITVPAERLPSPEKRFAVILNRRHIDLQVSDVATDAPGVKIDTTPTPDGSQVTLTLTFPTGFEIPAETKYHLTGKTNAMALRTFSIPILRSGP